MQRFCKTVKRLNWKHLRCPSLSSRCHRACRLVIFLMQIGPFHLHTQFKESSFVKTHILLPLLHGTPSSVLFFFFIPPLAGLPVFSEPSQTDPPTSTQADAYARHLFCLHGFISGSSLLSMPPPQAYHPKSPLFPISSM